MLSLFLLVVLLYASPLAAGLDFLFNSSSSIEFVFTGDATIDSSVIRLTSSREQSMGRVFYPYALPKNSRNMTTVSFATSFVFSIVPEFPGMGHGFAFVLSNTTVPPGARPSQFFGLRYNQSSPTSRLLVVEFDTVKNSEFDDPSSNHIGIDLNGPISSTTQEAAYYNSTTGELVPISMLSGNNIQAWIEFDGTHFGIKVTIAPVGIPKPLKPLISFYDPEIATLVFGDMYVGFSASNGGGIWASGTQGILAWTLATDGALRDMNTSNLPAFFPENPSFFPENPSKSSHLSVGIIWKMVISIFSLLISCLGLYWFCIRRRRRRMIRSKDKDDDNEDEVQRWELDYWPHRYTYEELAGATNGFSEDQLLGYGGFGRVYKGTESNNNNNSSTIAVKCINSDSKQGFKEFMAEISSIGRLQHKNLVRMRGWCKKGKEMLLVYDYMPNGSLYSWIFTKSETLSWQRRLIVLIDIAEGLNYLHNGWDHLVLHRDIKSSNVLLDADMRGRLGDFGLAKLCKHGQSLSMTNLVGTIGYMAPELVRAAPTKASDIYSFGVVVLEVVCGRRPTDLLFFEFERREITLIDWLRMLQKESKLSEAADLRIAGEEYSVGDMEMVLNLGLACCDAQPEFRSSMKEVLSSLMTLKLPASSEYSSSCNYRNQEEETSRISRVSFITEPGPRT